MFNYITPYEVMVNFHITPRKVVTMYFAFLLIFCVLRCPDIKTDKLQDASFREE